MRGTRAKMIRKHLRPLFSKEELKVKIVRYRNGFGIGESSPLTFRYSSDSFQRRYKDAKRAVV
ncbi:MAG TPA: hypothetical protein PLJ29_00065 [Leptospiraceae bacterium]|jgi:hypothetical protein|nr:hypothetical protein [Leptospiraceae bacterium]HNI24722.1 hypothetical protein [Leptospiraceae bacterium]